MSEVALAVALLASEPRDTNETNTKVAEARYASRGGVVFPGSAPKLVQRGTRGGRRTYTQANLTETRRIIKSLMNREVKVAAAEKVAAAAFTDLRQLKALHGEGSARYEAAQANTDLLQHKLEAKKAWRQFTADRLQLFIQAGLEKTANKTNPFTKASHAAFEQLAKVVAETQLCFKVKAGGSEANGAFEKLLGAHEWLVKKFGNPKKTSMEADDAAQGAVIGILDGARHFDPTKLVKLHCPRCGYEEPITSQDVKTKSCPECKLNRLMRGTSSAVFETVAYNWCFRNSRARKKTDKRSDLQFHLGDMAQHDAEEDRQTTVAATSTADRLSGRTSHQVHGKTDNLHEDVATKVAALPEDQRTVISLVLTNHKPSEIAEQLNMSLKDVKRLRDEAFEELRDGLAAYGDEEES